MKKVFYIIMTFICFTMAASPSICQENGSSANGQTKIEAPPKSEASQKNDDAKGKTQKQDLVAWMKYDEGMKKAQEKDLPVYVEFYATWCPPCKMMAQTTFQDKEVVSLLNDGFVSIKVDIDQEKELALRYGARSIPHHIVMNSKGDVLKVLRGAMPADIFLANLKEAVK
ncbi:thioredoxin family protein [Desulforegula conservatrix]|uniref:thioredoxin family protein n=1 Tax=Desulforegula conservatrix TaxID=153026 RepID=UPI00041E35C5|nr:thioredoxin family protein [Desulforegula conservatrix]